MGDPKQEDNNKQANSNTFDAIVVGTGISGGWAAKELCEKGLRTLVLERGRQVEHIKDYTTAFMRPWDFPNHLQPTRKQLEDDPVQGTSYDEGNKQFFVSDKEHPYIQDNPFLWIRGYQVGGRSLTWGRQCYRLSDLDFEANAKEGIAVDWPIRYADIAPWYDYVEDFIGVSGRAEGLPQLPDGQFLPPMEMNCIENFFAQNVHQHYPGRVVTIARVANLSQGWKGRGPCQYRNLCSRGCPFSGYFSSNAATLPAAALTGNMTLLPDSIVTEVLYDPAKRRATGVRVVNRITGKMTEYFARIIFLNASTVATAAILLNSKPADFPDGLGNSSGQLGHNLMDHFIGPSAQGDYEGMKDQYFSGRRPAGIYIPRFRNLDPAKPRKDFLRGYGLQGMGMRIRWTDLMMTTPGSGTGFKEKLLQPGPWSIWLGAWAETLPYYENKITLDKHKVDAWGQPIVRISFNYHDNEKQMAKDVLVTTQEMLQTAGFSNIRTYEGLRPPGAAVHEMGTARMGRDPKTSVLNSWNQLHDAHNVFVTDGSCMTSSGSQNPSLTYMALTARACNYAVSELKKGNL
ncbi:MAG TPA: GMC family oxidoreductase [Puia sp.]|uniref:GMC family oxidoreductase n=1 Tax=Puia sp. TaxID=2045100 RepID=UPI002CF5DFD0|nr:GMC family oxidoreductase [Puia sp.]HVU95086.1 GMC family oxidoreductase [Puia sp.]